MPTMTRCQELREAAGLSQHQLATHAEVSTNVVQRFESAECWGDLEKSYLQSTYRLARYFRVAVVELIPKLGRTGA